MKIEAQTYVQANTEIFNKIEKDKSFRESLYADPVATLKAQGFEIKPFEEAFAALMYRQAIATSVCSALSNDELRSLAASDSNYISAEAGWLGVYITLSSQAVSDVANVMNIAAGVTAAISAIASAFPAGLAISVIGGLITAALAASAAVLSVVNRGNGVVVLIGWSSFTYPIVPIPVIIPYPA